MNQFQDDEQKIDPILTIVVFIIISSFFLGIGKKDLEEPIETVILLD